jgi:hypothetical protein
MNSSVGETHYTVFTGAPLELRHAAICDSGAVALRVVLPWNSGRIIMCRPLRSRSHFLAV